MDGLTDKQLRAIPFVVAAASIEEGCRRARIAKATFYIWLKEPSFADALKQARQGLFEQALERVKANMDAAVDTLAALMRRAKKEETRARCSQAILEYGLRLKSMENLEERIGQLEAALWAGRDS
jgi:hypothetical protein